MASRIDVVLRTLPGQMKSIRKQYERSLTDREISDELLHEIARLVEDCQRALDWTATDIDQAHGKASDRSPYYPLHDTQDKFEAAMRRDFQRVPQNVHDAMEQHQPYQQGKEALKYLHDLARVNKHQDFTPQTRTETRYIRASSPGVDVQWNPGMVRFGSGVSIGGVPVDVNTQRPIPSPMQEVTEIVYVGWIFAKLGVLVLPTLESLAILIPAAVKDVRQSAGL